MPGRNFVEGFWYCSEETTVMVAWFVQRALGNRISPIPWRPQGLGYRPQTGARCSAPLTISAQYTLAGSADIQSQEFRQNGSENERPAATRATARRFRYLQRLT